jgi:hypothetical protein
MLYIAETSLDYLTGYSIHVMKSVDNIYKVKKTAKLYVPKFRLKKNKLKKRYNLYNLNHIEIIQSVFYNYNFFLFRMFFGFQSALYAKKNLNKTILTRSIWSSIFMVLFNVQHILEIHNISKGVAGFILIKLNIINSKIIKKVVVINYELVKYLSLKKKKFIVLPDAVDLRNFNIKKRKKFTKENILYYGSFFKGRGLSLIFQIADHFKDIKFTLIGGSKKFMDIRNKNKNIKLFKQVDYSKIPKILKQFDFVLMPYETKVYVNSRNLDTSEYMSPLKMFEALAMGNIILSSNFKILKKVLKNNYNSLIVKKNTSLEWIKLIESLKKKNNFQKISNNAIKTAKFYSWENRVTKILKL